MNIQEFIQSLQPSSFYCGMNYIEDAGGENMKTIEELEQELKQLKETQNSYELFGRLTLEWIKDQDDFIGDEFSIYILPLAQRAGLVKRVIYDPVIHGEDVEAEPGDEIWFWED